MKTLITATLAACCAAAAGGPIPLTPASAEKAQEFREQRGIMERALRELELDASMVQQREAMKSVFLDIEHSAEAIRKRVEIEQSVRDFSVSPDAERQRRALPAPHHPSPPDGVITSAFR